MQGARQLNSSNSDAADLVQMKHDLSLDLGKSKMSIDDTSMASSKQNQNVSSNSNTPNCTQTSGSTSQSMTPSEFGYQNLNRQSDAISIGSSPKSEDYETIEHAFKNYEQCVTVKTPIQKVSTPIKSKSPIKSTINITYNAVSPARNSTQTNFVFSNDRPISPDPNQFPDYEPVDVTSAEPKPSSLLETSFDENVVYEQLKFFKGAVSEVNHLLDNDNNVQQNVADSEFSDSLNKTSQIVPNISHNLNTQNAVDNSHANDVTSNENSTNGAISDDKSDSGDVLMPDQELVPDSLEFDPNLSMYENVKLRKPINTYENVDMRSSNRTKSLNMQESITHLSAGKENNKPANFTVKQLANKFETSPVDSLPPFDFSKPSFLRKNCDTNRNSANPPKAKNPQQQQLNKTNFTRSLDENAFVREFGSGRSTGEKVNKSTQQIPVVTNVLTENSPSRRILNESVRPKSLNPSKRLPNLIDTENEDGKGENDDADETMIIANYEIKITPTTENPISLIQHNVNMIEQQQKAAGDDDRNSTNGANNKVLGVKLDRERIEKIKEERRHQLNEKFRSESFKCEKENNKAKSKSKIELNELKDSDKKISDSLQYKSKSRNEIYNKKDADASIVPNSLPNRVRRIGGDDKNDGDEQSVAFRMRKFDRLSIDLKREQDNFSISSATVGQRNSAHIQ